MESEKKRQEKQMEKEEKEKRRNEEKKKKQKELEQKQKEKELKEAQKREEKEKKEEQKRKALEEKEQKRKEKEEKEEQKKKEREMEKLKKQQELEEKNKEKQKEEEKKQKAAAAFVNFFVAKKSDATQEQRTEETTSSLFKGFEVKSDMRLPPIRRSPLSAEEVENLDICLQKQMSSNYLTEIKMKKNIGTSSKTWPYEETSDEDVVIVEDSINLGESICGDNSKLQKFRTKFLKFHENRRPAYYGTWRKKSKFITARRPFAEDDILNYDEDSDDDWEEEEQGESLNGSDDEEKEIEEEKDEYEVDNEFFVPHGHLSDDEVDDEENARLSPESLKQKLKLLKDEFDQDMKSKTHKLKSRSIGCIWYNKDGSNIDDATHRYLQPFAIIAHAPIQIKNRDEIFVVAAVRKSKPAPDLNPEYVPYFLKVIHGNTRKKTVLVDQFVKQMADKGTEIDLKKGTLVKILKRFAAWKPLKEKGNKTKFCWQVHEDVEKKFDVNLAHLSESDIKK